MKEQKNIPIYTDETITCVDCGETFIFTIGERAYFTSTLLAIPKRCKECRAIRRAGFNQRKLNVDGNRR